MESKIVPYTNQEKILLASLVYKYKVVENKKTDATNVQQKQLSWQKIAVEYNAQADFISCPRTDTQLKKLWNNLKQRKRKANTEVHYARLQTGGGPPPKEEDDPVMEAVEISAPYADVEVECPWDCTEEYKRSRKISYSEDHKRASRTVIQSLPSTSNITIESLPSTSTNSESLPCPCTTETASPSSAMLPQDVTTDSSVPINTSTPSVTRLTNSNKRGVALLASESNLRVKKLQEAIVQQQELHRVRMDMENELLEKTRAEKNKAKYEEELAHLKLLMFKKEVAQKPT